jgi:hypothetical protein
MPRDTHTNLAQQLAQKRQMLLRRSAQQRQSLRTQQRELQASLYLADASLRLIQLFRRRPLMLAATLAGIVVFKPRRALPILRNALLGWSLWLKVAPAMARMRTGGK